MRWQRFEKAGPDGPADRNMIPRAPGLPHASRLDRKARLHLVADLKRAAEDRKRLHIEVRLSERERARGRQLVARELDPDRGLQGSRHAMERDRDAQRCIARRIAALDVDDREG